MRNAVYKVVCLGLIAASGCVVTVNGKKHVYGLNGEEKQPEDGKQGAKGDGKQGGTPSVDELAAAVAAGATTPAGQSVTLKPDFAPNPSSLGTFSTRADVNVYDQPHGATSCSGYVGDGPAAIVTFTSAMRETRISAPGARLILAEMPDRKYVCKESYGDDAPSVKLDEWPAGSPIKLYAGGRKGESYNYELRVEDEKRPLDIAWKDKVKPVELGEVPKDPIIVSEITSSKPGSKSAHCDSGYFHEVPEMALLLKRPLGDMSIEVRSAKRIAVQLVGPMTENGRNIPTRCMNDDRASFGRMEAGLYALRIGTEASGQEVLYHIVVRGKDTSRNPVAAPSKFADTIALEESVTSWHFPQLTMSDAEAGDANREALFMAAPKALFVFPKFNMDKSVASIVGASNGSSDKSKSPPAPELPRENEPLLLLDRSGYVMAADGSFFRVNMKDLQADPGGAISVPAAPRNTGLTFERALAGKGPEDAKAVAAYEKAEKAVDTCHDRQNSSVEGGFEGACTGLEKAAERSKDALEKELAKNRIARRSASLGKIKTRLETLFKK